MHSYTKVQGKKTKVKRQKIKVKKQKLARLRRGYKDKSKKNKKFVSF